MTVKTFSSKAQLDRFLEDPRVVTQEVKRVFDRTGFVWTLTYITNKEY
jgi:hypothetical protein